MSQNRFDLHESINGDYVVGFTNVKELKTLGWMDSAKVSTYLMDEKDSHRKHLGLINLFATSHKQSMPFLKDLFSNAAVLEVAEGQSITYDLPVDRTEVKCYTAEDTSAEVDFPGIDGGVFALVLSNEFTKGDILGYDPVYGQQVMVSTEHEVEQVAENFRHYVTLQTNDKKKYFPKEKLKAGIEYVKISHKLNEFGTDYSSLTLSKGASGTITNEFLLADPRGIETFITGKASRMKSAGLTSFTNDQAAKINGQIEALGGKNMMFYAKKDSNTGKLLPGLIGSTLEYLAMMELSQMETNELLFARAATVSDANGVKRVNEGVWHQIRRGKLIKYSRQGGITLDHIYEAASYIYQGSQIPVGQRIVKFKAGWLAHQNMLQLFREHAMLQLNGLSTVMLGQNGQLPGTVFTGEMDNLAMKNVAITSVQFPNVGTVTVEHDPSLDYLPSTDRYSAGFYSDGYAHTSNSLIIWDVTNPEYSNLNKVKNADLVAGGSKQANIYYVKPEGASHITYGYEQGRMANEQGGSNVQSSLKQMGKSFWAYSQSSALVLDTTRYVTIELQEKGRGF
jgi:hypothetical protein